MTMRLRQPSLNPWYSNRNRWNPFQMNVELKYYFTHETMHQHAVLWFCHERSTVNQWQLDLFGDTACEILMGIESTELISMSETDGSFQRKQQ